MKRTVKPAPAPAPAPAAPPPGPTGAGERALTIGSWTLAGALVCAAVLLLIFYRPSGGISPTASPEPEATPSLPISQAAPQSYIQNVSYFPRKSLVRITNPHTEITDKGRKQAEEYTVAEGDSLFVISKKFDLKPETIFWANYDAIQGSPDLLRPNLNLVIPPSDGIYYRWKEGDTLAAVADQYKVTPQDILEEPFNRLDLSNPVIHPGDRVLIPGGKAEVVQWFQGAIPRGSAGTLAKLFGDGGCAAPVGGAYGDGVFGNPMAGGVLIGNDYISGVHQGVDLGSLSSGAILAADSGVVVYSGWANGGYGNTIMIDHGNGYQTLYAHMSVLYAACGASVAQGQAIGVIGSTGNSTGPHLHFEIRYMGLNDNPWNYIF